MADVTPVPAQASPASKKRSSGRVGNLIHLFEAKEEPKPTPVVAPKKPTTMSTNHNTTTNNTTTTTTVVTTTSTSTPTLTRTRSLTNGGISSNIRLPANLLPSTPRYVPSNDKKPSNNSKPVQETTPASSVDVNTMVVNTNVSQGVKQRLAKLIKKTKNLEHTPTLEEPISFPIPPTSQDKKDHENHSDHNSDVSNSTPPNSTSPRNGASLFEQHHKEEQYDMDHFYQVLQTVLPFPPPALQAALGVDEEQQHENSNSFDGANRNTQSYHSVNIPTMDLLQAYRLKSIVFHRRFKNFAFHNPFPHTNNHQASPLQVIPLASDEESTPVIPSLPESLFGGKSLDFVSWQQQMKSKIAA